MKQVADFFKSVQNLAIIVLLIMLFIALRDCKGKADKNIALKQQNDSLIAKVKRDSAASAKAYESYLRDALQAKVEREQLVREKEATERKLTDAQSKVTYYSSLLNKYRYENDSITITVPVSENYVLYCDSLDEAAQQLVRDVDQYKEQVSETEKLMYYEIKIRDSIIEKGVKTIAELRADFNAQTHFFNQAIKNNKPRGRLMGGFGVMGNEADIFYGASGKLAYQTKGGKQYQVAGHVLKGGVYYEATVLFTIIR